VPPRGFEKLHDPLYRTGRGVPTGKYRVSAAGKKFSRKQIPMNANLFKKSRRGCPHLSACHRVCIRSRQSLRGCSRSTTGLGL